MRSITTTANMALVAISNPHVFGSGVCGDLSEGAAREWLVPDGAGGYAMGTVSGLRTRRYHALLVVAESGGSARRVGLAALDPVLVTESGAEVRLAVHEWASGAIAPDGHTLLESFTLEQGLPRWRWRVGDIVLEAELAAVHGRPAYGYVYRLLAGGPVTLRVEALCTWRDQHGDRFAGGGDPQRRPTADGVVVEEAYRLAGPGWTAGGQWYRDVQLREEAARGLGSHEDLWFAGSFRADLTGPGQTLEVTAWAGDLASAPPPAAQIVATARDRARTIQAKGADPVAARLLLAADAFVVDRTAADGATVPDVIAGYPWFGTWSRDTMLSYDGLFLASGRFDEGRRLLRGYAATLSEGMLANTADTGSVEYNTADATLWFVHAIGRHVATTGDTDLAAELAPALDGILQAHLDGTRYGIRVDPADSLLTQGADGYALTWMDARVDGQPITQRRGKAVEINALWINALGTVADLWKAIGRDATTVLQRRAAAATSFQRRFPNPDCGLYDVVDGPAGDDASLRPNQLLAYSLPYAPLRGQAPAAIVGRKLMTPLGMRTLPSEDPAYQPHHRGSPAQRDAAYHQGTVWPWLLGAYRDALAVAGGSTGGLTVSPTSSSNGGSNGGSSGSLPGGPAEAVFGGLPGHLGEAGLGSVSETADGAAPHTTTGCPFQAWSVAEALRAWTSEYVDRT
ncbi:amylo-alpha-1,6-glucosidase [Catenulispora pinisilvae]|uniref:amylo-alpha-1,6-glucosidase n=1 Tax=Catenulispora pinisilvae TaxID=2705253 RepID=UPI001890BF1E|nr:amylo-alpha-1,6-glucosidase [Catenulispora pinisilvae]